MFFFFSTEITVGVIDDDIFEEDEYFYVHLSNPRVVGYPEAGAAPLDAGVGPKAVLGDNHTATVTIYDDDHAGDPLRSRPYIYLAQQKHFHHASSDLAKVPATFPDFVSV